jgi:hydroxymethylbilane synthase
MKISAGARESPLSRAQFEEIRLELPRGVILEPVWVKTTGDLDKKTSLRTLGKCDFFTRELDQMLLRGEIRIAVHSAKDLPEPLPSGLTIVALTRGVDPRDCLVMRSGDLFEKLPSGAVIATSSARREETVRSLRPDLRFIDLRGTIGERLQKLDNREADGVVLAEAALVRLKLTHLNRIFLPGEPAQNQGRLAVLARTGDEEMRRLFAQIHCENRHCYTNMKQPQR